MRPKRFPSLWYVRHKPCTYLAPTLAPNRPKRDSTCPTSPRSTIGCVQNDFPAYGMFGANRAPILHRHWLLIDQNEIPLDPRHLGVPSGVSKMISEPMVCSAQTVHLSCTDTGSQQTETRFHMTHVTLEYHLVHPKRFLRLWYVWHKPCTYLALALTPSPNELKRDLTRPTSPRSSIGCIQNDSEPMVRSTQTVNLSCVKISTISKWTKTSFHLSLVTQWFHRVRPKRFLSLWYV